MKREYYKMPFFRYDRFEGATGPLLLAVFLMVPILLIIGGLTLVIEYAGLGPIAKILLFVVGTISSFAWMIIGGKTWDKIATKDTYELKIPDADRYVKTRPITDETELIELEKTGGLHIRGEPDAEFKKFMYNLFTDYNIRKQENITICSIDRNLFLKHYSYYEEKYYEYTTLYVVPFDQLGTDWEGYLKKTKKNPNLFRSFGYLEDLLDGIYTEYDFGFRYRYRKIRKEISEGTT